MTVLHPKHEPCISHFLPVVHAILFWLGAVKLFVLFLLLISASVPCKLLPHAISHICHGISRGDTSLCLSRPLHAPTFFVRCLPHPGHAAAARVWAVLIMTSRKTTWVRRQSSGLQEGHGSDFYRPPNTRMTVYSVIYWDGAQGFIWKCPRLDYLSRESVLNQSIVSLASDSFTFASDPFTLSRSRRPLLTKLNTPNRGGSVS
jgi:hypothetical protein